VYFTDDAGHVHELAWVGSSWNTTDLTAVTNAPPAAAAGSALASHDNPTGLVGSRVYFTDDAGHVHELAWVGSSWNTTDLNIELAPPHWMKGVDGGVYLSQLSIPGTHDTLTYDATLVAQDQDNAFDIAAQLAAGIRSFDLRLAEDDPSGSLDGSGAILVGCHGSWTFGPVSDPFVLANTDFWVNILAPTIQFLQANPTECVIYGITNCGQTLNCGGVDPTWEDLLHQYITKYGPGDRSWGGFYMSNQMPKLDDVRGKILVTTGDTAFLKKYGGMDGSGGPYNNWGTDGNGAPYTNSFTMPDGTPVSFYVQDIYDDSAGKAAMSTETAAIQGNIAAAAANTSPSNWYMTGTSRASGEPTSKFFATGWSAGQIPLPYPSTWEGYNTVAQDQINQVPITGTVGRDQKTVGVVASDFPNDTPGYIQAIINRNPRINQVPVTSTVGPDQKTVGVVASDSPNDTPAAMREVKDGAFID
jgi:hypothetical protein